LPDCLLFAQALIAAAIHYVPGDATGSPLDLATFAILLS